MLPITIATGVLGIVAALLAAFAPHTELWAIMLIGCIAVVGGTTVSIWADPKAPRWWSRNNLKTFYGVVAGLALAPGLLIGFALFVFMLLPALVLILPLIAVWDFAIVRRHPEPEPAVPHLIPRHA